jgi:hypothetical protein
VVLWGRRTTNNIHGGAEARSGRLVRHPRAEETR